MSTRILLVNGSPRKKSNSAVLLEEAREGIQTVEGAEAELFEFAGRTISGCNGTCYAYCQKNGRCIADDDLTPFSKAFWSADGIIWVVPTYHAAPPAQVKAALDRLSNLVFSYTRGRMPRFNKAWGVIVHGSSQFGGQELNAQFLFNSALQFKCIPVAGDSPDAVTAVMGQSSTWEPGIIREDKAAMTGAKNLGCRVAEMARILQSGLESQRHLDEIYGVRALQAKLLLCAQR